MKRFKTLSLKKKRTLTIAGIGLVVLTVGGTIAYNQTMVNFNNNFKLATDEIEAIDIVPVERNKAQPCDEFPKTAVVKNKNDDPRYVRMKIVTYWRVENSTQTDHETSDLPLTWTDGTGTHEYAYYNTQNDDKWNLNNDGWYYYYQPLAGGATTESLLKSAVFNCDANFGGEMGYSNDGKTAETVESPYSNAEFHIYVTFQISDEDMTPQRPRLYDEVARQTQGSDANIDFNASAVTKDLDIGRYFATNEEGVFTYSGQAAGDKAVHYYRGYITNNFVKFHDICWRIVRTTGTGGTKVMYSGAVKADGTCPIKSSAVTYTSMNYSSGTQYGMMSPQSGLVGVGYMFNSDYHFDGYDKNGNYISKTSPTQDYTNNAALVEMMTSTVKVSRSATYENGVYKLAGDSADFPSNNYYDAGTPRYYYTCFSDDINATCTRAGYIVSSEVKNGYGWLFYWPLTDGLLGEQAKKDFLSNDRDSQLKTYLDNWYANNLTNETDKFEDTKWCNDRKIIDGPYAFKDDKNYGPTVTTFAGYDRIMNGTPAVDCERADDQFTVSSNNGNGKLTYPTLIVTADELMLSGYKWVEGNADWRMTSLYGTQIFSMTPAISKSYSGRLPDSGFIFSQRGDYDTGNLIYESNMNGYGIRPMVSFKYDTYVEGGTGTAIDPYTLEW